ncbi:MAG: hypothetical protein IKF17_05795 [Clostridia bacterium]|nr:hypothetical protein [Clostridia bacterium]
MRIIDLDNLSEKEKNRVLNEQNEYLEQRKQESLNLQNRANEEFNNLTRYIDTRKTQIAPIKNVVSRFSNMGQSASTGIKRGLLNKITNITDRGKYIGKSLGANILQGTAGIPQAVITESANEMRKGKEKDANGILNQIGKAIVNNKANNIIDDTIRITKSDLETIKNKDKNLWEKLVGITTNHVSESSKAVTPGYSIFSALNQSAGKIAPQASNVALDLNNKISAPIKDLQQRIAEEGQNYDGVTRFLGEGASVIGNMAPSLAISAITKNPEMALGVMGLSAKGQSTNEAIDRGADLDEAVKIGDTKALVEIGTEKMTGGAKLFGGGTTAEEALRNQIKNKVGNRVLQSIANAGLDIAGEGLEETVSDIVDTAIDKGTTDRDASYSLKDWGKTQGITALTTLALNGLGIGGNAITQRINNIATAPINQTQNQPTAPINTLIQQQDNIVQNESIEQTQPSKIEEKVNNYIEGVKDNFTTNIDINSNVVQQNNRIPINYKAQTEATVFRRAKDIFNTLQKRVFKNGSTDIYVDNSDIKESIHHTLKDNTQKKLLNENLAVYSQLDKVIENATQISEDTENKGRNKFSDWKYYASNVNIDGNPYVVEFDTTMKDGQRHFRLERVYKINGADVATDSSNNMTPRFECNICSY